MHYRGPTRGTTPPNTGSKSPFSKSIFQNPKEQSKTPSLFPATSVNTGFNPFTGYTQPKSTTPEKKSIHTTNPMTGMFPAQNPSSTLFTNPFPTPSFRPVTPPNTSTSPLFPNPKPTGVSPQQLQAQVNQLLQLKKDNELQKQTMEQMLIRIRQLEAKNTELEKQKTQLLQHNILLENTIKTYQQQTSLTFAPVNQQHQYNPMTQTASMQPIIQQIKPIKQNPIHFDYSKKNQLFTGQMPPSILSQDEIMPKAWTQKTFLTTDGYAFQAYVAFNAFYVVKYIILQKVKNIKGYLDLNESTGTNLTQQSKDKRGAHWHLYHQNSAKNVIPQECIEHLTQLVIKQMKDNDSTPININIPLGKYITISDSKCTVFHPAWTINVPFELQLYDFYSYNTLNQETKNIMKKNIAEWIQEKTKEHADKKQAHQLLMWFDETKGIFHLIWK